MDASADPIKSRLQHDLTAAMKARDETSTSTIRMLLTAITTAEVAGSTAVELDDPAVTAVLRSEAKKRRESAELYAANARPELAAREQAELAVIERYLPASIDEAALSDLVDDAIAAAAADGAAGPKAMGQVIRSVRERAGAGADGARIAALVKERLGS